MILIIHERKAPLFRGRPDFYLAESYRKDVDKIDPHEIGFYFDELSNNVVRVITSDRVQLKDEQGRNVLGWAMTEETFLHMNVQTKQISNPSLS